jgi:hypothetical protein
VLLAFVIVFSMLFSSLYVGKNADICFIGLFGSLYIKIYICWEAGLSVGIWEKNLSIKELLFLR